MKLFRLDLPPERVHQLVAEFDIFVAAGLTHPAIAAPIVAGMTGVSAYLVQDFVAAESLDVALRDGPLPVASLLGVVAQLAAALDVAAAAGVEHGGVHPRDVLLSSDEVRLTGLGVARALEKVGVPAPVRRPYTAPERVFGAPWDRHADVFSLAAIVHEIVWRRRVSGMGVEAAESLTEVAGGDLDELRRVFARALDENPDERYESATAFAEALKDGFADSVVTSHQSPVTSHQSPVASLESPVEDATSITEAPAPVKIRRSRAKLRLATTDLPLPTDERPSTDEGRLTTDDGRLTTDAEPRLPLDASETPSDLELHALDRESEPPAIVVPEPLLPHALSASLEFTHVVEERPPVFSALERSRPAMWPLLLALFAGASLGFAGGYGLGIRDRSVVTGQTGQAGRTFTDGAVTEAPKTPVARVAAAPAIVKPAVPPAARTSRTASTSRTLGSLSVMSRPSGAKVFIDGRAAGTTPLSLARIGAGAHAIRIERAGYRAWSSSITVAAKRRARITAALEK